MKTLTAAIAAKAVELLEPNPEARIVARQCMLDWFGVTLAGSSEPLVDSLAELADEDGAAANATLIGRGWRASVSQAALVNGAAGHALDYDDVITTMGHPTVPVAPVVLALGEARRSTDADMLAAFIAGVETEVMVARLLGPSHYARGFHGTATFGTFGAAAAAGRLLGLDTPAMTMALGIAGTQAAGLKAVFGTMCKPLHAGKAAANGLLAAQLAARGFTSHPDILAAPQGFGATQSDAIDPAAALQPPAGGFHIRQTLFKYHAACYLTHSAICAAIALRNDHNVRSQDVVTADVGVDPGHLAVCAIPAPSTGLECKFSLAQTIAFALAGENTGDEALYSDASASRPDLVALRDRVTVTPRRAASATLSDVKLLLADGRTIRAEADVAVPAHDLNRQWQLLTDKFHALADPVIGSQAAAEMVELCRTIGTGADGSLRRLIALAAARRTPDRRR